MQLAKKIGKITEADIINAATNSGNLKPEDICVRKCNMHFGMKEKNPLSEVSFFRVKQDGQYEKFNKRPEEISTMLPEHVMSTCIRVYCKDESKFELAQNAFKQFCVEKLGGEALMARYHSHSQNQHS